MLIHVYMSAVMGSITHVILQAYIQLLLILARVEKVQKDLDIGYIFHGNMME